MGAVLIESHDDSFVLRHGIFCLVQDSITQAHGYSLFYPVFVSVCVAVNDVEVSRDFAPYVRHTATHRRRHTPGATRRRRHTLVNT